MKVRKAQPNDYAQVMELLTGLVGDDRFAKAGNDSFERFLADEDYAIFVAETDEGLIGVATASVRWAVRYPRPIAQLEELFVDPHNRVHGVGRALVETVEEFCRGHDCYRLYIESHMQHEDAHVFYEHIGYEKAGVYFVKSL